jgi:uncharacterized membrane protein
MTNLSNLRILTLLTGWVLAFYGVQRRSWSGTIVALAGLGLAETALTAGKGELR